MRRVLRPPVLLVVGWAALAVTWAFSNPPFAAPDEGMHYLRTLGVEQGQFVGPRPDPATVFAYNDQQHAWLVQVTREVQVATRRLPPDPDCYVFVRDTSAACLAGYEAPLDPVVAMTQVGTYQPLPYLLPAVAIKPAHSPEQALRLGRLACALLALSLLALAAAAAWDARTPGISLLGPALAVTPMVIFCSAILNGSSLEITAGIAFIACLFRLLRGARPATWVWIGAGVSGAALALSRSGAPLVVGLAAAGAVAVQGPRETWHTLRAGGRPAAVAVAAVVVAIIGNGVWEAAYGPELPTGLTDSAAALETGLDRVPHWLQEMIGQFGYLEFALPLPVYIFWGLATLAAVAGALRWASMPGKVVLAVCLAALVLLPLSEYVLVQRHTGFGVQGRHVLPILVIVPLLAGELLRRNHERIAATRVRYLIILSFAGIALVQFTALYWNGRRSAVGLDGPLLFLDDAEWSPPIGWGIWLALAAAGAASLAAAGVLAVKPERAG